MKTFYLLLMTQYIKSYNSFISLESSNDKTATKPMVIKTTTDTAYYLHDGNKNVVTVLSVADSTFAQYEYSPFGAIAVSTGEIESTNFFCFSSEYLDSELGLIYYNYRHYNPLDGRWLNRDPIAEDGGWNLYGMINNYMINIFDYLGQEDFEGHVDLGILTNLNKVTGTILIGCPPSLDNISVNFVEPTFKTKILEQGPTYEFLYIYDVELESIVTIGKGEKCGDCQTYNVALDVNMQVTYSEETYRKRRLVALKKGNKESKDGFSRNFLIECCEDETEDEV